MIKNRVVYLMSHNKATPRKIQCSGSCLPDGRSKGKMQVRSVRRGFLQTGQTQQALRSLGSLIAQTQTTGKVVKRTLGDGSLSRPTRLSQLAPSKYRPCMQTPSGGGAVTSSFIFEVTSLCKNTASSDHFLSRVIFCFIAVKKPFEMRESKLVFRDNNNNLKYFVF